VEEMEGQDGGFCDEVLVLAAMLSCLVARVSWLVGLLSILLRAVLGSVIIAGYREKNTIYTLVCMILFRVAGYFQGLVCVVEVCGDVIHQTKEHSIKELWPSENSLRRHQRSSDEYSVFISLHGCASGVVDVGMLLCGADK
jgi:hypothetical protein